MRKLTPQQRWDKDTRELRFPESAEALRRPFILTETRRVRNDNVIPIDEVAYEVPRGHVGQQITVVRHLLDDLVRVLHDGELVRVHPADLHANALAHRAKGAAPPPDCDEAIPTTAAELAFRKEFGPLVGPHGDYEPPEKGEDEP
jgi:hypothetical protein